MQVEGVEEGREVEEAEAEEDQEQEEEPQYWVTMWPNNQLNHPTTSK